MEPQSEILQIVDVVFQVFPADLVLRVLMPSPKYESLNQQCLKVPVFEPTEIDPRGVAVTHFFCGPAKAGFIAKFGAQDRKFFAGALALRKVFGREAGNAYLDRLNQKIDLGFHDFEPVALDKFRINRF